MIDETVTESVDAETLIAKDSALRDDPIATGLLRMYKKCERTVEAWNDDPVIPLENSASYLNAINSRNTALEELNHYVISRIKESE